MPENYLVRINGNSQREVKMRVVGIIEEDHIESLLNSEDGAKKASTSESFDVNETSGINKRFVAVVQDVDDIKRLPNAEKKLDKDLKGTIIPYLFISAKIKGLSYSEGNRVYTCHDKNSFQFIPINKAGKA